MTKHKCPTCGSMVDKKSIKNTGHDVEGEPIWKCPMCSGLQIEADTASW